MAPRLRGGELGSGICQIMTPCWEVGSTEMSRLRKGRDALSPGRLRRAAPDAGVALAYPDVNRSLPPASSLLLHRGPSQGPALALILLLGFAPVLVIHVVCSP